MLAIEAHRHPAVTAILYVRGIHGGLDLVATKSENRRSILGYKQRCMPRWLHKAALATTAASGRNGWIPDLRRHARQRRGSAGSSPSDRREWTGQIDPKRSFLQVLIASSLRKERESNLNTAPDQHG
jgi:hypothetical protein